MTDSPTPPDAPQSPQPMPQQMPQGGAEPARRPIGLPTGGTPPMAGAAAPVYEDRAYMEALNIVFDKFALKDQRSFYRSANERNAAAARQVNQIRAMLAFMTGLSAALAGLLVQVTLPVGLDEKCFASNVSGATVPFFGIPVSCSLFQIVIVVSLIFTVVMPAFAAAFNILSDLYQWDRLLVFYQSAIEKVTVADALSPLPEMDDRVYEAALKAFSEGALGVMADETAQWGQLIRTPPTIEQFLKEADERAARYDGRQNRPDSFFPGAGAPPQPSQPSQPGAANPPAG